MSNTTAVEEASVDPEICQRCGTYAATREHWGRHWCDDCMARRDPIEVDPPTIGNLVKHSFALALRTIKPALVLSLVFYAAPALLLRQHPPLISLCWASVGLFGRTGLQRLAFLQVVSSKPTTLQQALRHAFKRLPATFGTMSFVGLEVFLFSLLLVIPGLLRGLTYIIAIPTAVNERTSPNQALAISRTLMAGHRADAFFAYVLLSLPALATACLGAVEAYARTKHGAPAAIDAREQLLLVPVSVILGIPSGLLGVVLHLKLSQNRMQISASARLAERGAAAT